MQGEQWLWERAGAEGTSRRSVLGGRFTKTKCTRIQCLRFILTILGRVVSRREARQDTV